jgi:hypothetical protein
MSKVPLLNQLNKKLSEDEDKKSSPLAEGIKYQQYEVEVNGKPTTVNIPLREAANFEARIVEHDGALTRKTLKVLLREFRGIRG